MENQQESWTQAVEAETISLEQFTLNICAIICKTHLSKSKWMDRASLDELLFNYSINHSGRKIRAVEIHNRSNSCIQST
ncbi:hypothetical protein FGO68_gene487 [Halteria grandinella]|uniref:Uncharacterized protein n=1 Tax=Halteria grandinella TaxID=5974 RepID=A0A8J8NIV9_HALGN|nr:hypothetical protein FGO68_gene487 [Halteria grandinella]